MTKQAYIIPVIVDDKIKRKKGTCPVRDDEWMYDSLTPSFKFFNNALTLLIVLTTALPAFLVFISNYSITLH